MINLPGIGFLGGASEPRVATYRDVASSGSTLSTYSFAAMAFGPAYSSRKILVAITARGNTTIGVINSVTIGGITAAVVAQFNNTAGGNITLTAFAIASVPTGITGTVVVDFSTSKLRCAAATYDISGTQSDTPFNSEGTSGTPAGVNVAEGGCAIGTAFSSNSTAFTWTGLAEDYDNIISGGNTSSSASKNGIAAGVFAWDGAPSSANNVAKLAVSY